MASLIFEPRALADTPPFIGPGVSENLSPYHAELAVASGSQLPVCPSTATIVTWAELDFYDLPLIRPSGFVNSAAIIWSIVMPARR